MRTSQKGLTLLKLMTLLAIAGLLGAGLVEYQTRGVRAKVLELLLAANTFKTAITEKAQSNGTLTGAGEGLSIVEDSGMISKESTISADGVIRIVGIDRQIGIPVTLTLSPTRNASDGKIVWTCAADAATKSKYVPPECRQR
jgi:Tfp pilus assembly major pilin PilA